jgi:DNA-directed RNA polymerase beta' subunit
MIELGLMEAIKKKLEFVCLEEVEHIEKKYSDLKARSQCTVNHKGQNYTVENLENRVFYRVLNSSKEILGYFI